VVAAILRDARLWRAPQDEVLFRGDILDPHGEERRSRRVSNHEAEYAAGPFAIARPSRGSARCCPRIFLTAPLVAAYSHSQSIGVYFSPRRFNSERSNSAYARKLSPAQRERPPLARSAST